MTEPFVQPYADSSAWIRSGSRTRNYLQGEGDRARKVRRAENTFFALRCHFDYSRISSCNCCIPRGGHTLLCATGLRRDLTHTASAYVIPQPGFGKQSGSEIQRRAEQSGFGAPESEHHVPEWAFTTEEAKSDSPLSNRRGERAKREPIALEAALGRGRLCAGSSCDAAPACSPEGHRLARSEPLSAAITAAPSERLDRRSACSV